MTVDASGERLAEFYRAAKIAVVDLSLDADKGETPVKLVEIGEKRSKSDIAKRIVKLEPTVLIVAKGSISYSAYAATVGKVKYFLLDQGTQLRDAVSLLRRKEAWDSLPKREVFLSTLKSLLEKLDLG
jgi:hypothetical protein